ncbi:hypothetical protein JRQ81_014393 [Phrynocephalus forsythii]|uniref:Uncharacterized protein n=1 Tax=Phrynocephalus forsythii TaxID=171643 RepID=A0A9Q0XZ85_9SAUR|nr:hypothetical protein JRQ81_014393 [Phrynocephalus forsythii]
MDEENLEAAIQTYNAQLQQVELALGAGLDPSQQSDLIQLQADLKQLIELTESSLVSVRKSKLFSTLEPDAISTSHGQLDNPEPDRQSPDDEYAAFKEAIDSIGEDNPSSACNEEGDREAGEDEELEEEEEEEEEEEKKKPVG